MASAFLVYDSNECPLPSGRIDIMEIAWIGSILGIGGVIGTMAVGWIADNVGRKNSLLAMAVPQIVGHHFNHLEEKKHFFFTLFTFSHTAQLFMYYLCTKCLLFVYVTFFNRIRGRRSVRSHTIDGC